ncbi:hypothetical protein P7K49_026780 [Saguinus oedipus]|uniref:C-type lectin domain-containing protein n=1 Tax=Saguinus oedipus TaxID=9490 RepID=A0ABQ9UF12_SAGOE|nr:hypothetical protein P7K49_026780 [Saguinus oedipus]
MDRALSRPEIAVVIMQEMMVKKEIQEKRERMEKWDPWGQKNNTVEKWWEYGRSGIKDEESNTEVIRKCLHSQSRASASPKYSFWFLMGIKGELGDIGDQGNIGKTGPIGKKDIKLNENKILLQEIQRLFRKIELSQKELERYVFAGRLTDYGLSLGCSLSLLILWLEAKRLEQKVAQTGLIFKACQRGMAQDNAPIFPVRTPETPHQKTLTELTSSQKKRPNANSRNCDKGEKGLFGKPGKKGKAGTVCDCGRYRTFVGQLDISIARLKTSMKFVKNVIAGIRETEEKFYYIVQEEKNYRESLTHCRIRGGMLAMPKDEAANSLIADYVAKSGFFRVFIGVNDLEREGQYVFADNTPLQNYSNWNEGEPSDPSGREDCVEMLSSGRWNDTECHLTMYFVCEFIKKKK